MLNARDYQAFLFLVQLNPVCILLLIVSSHWRMNLLMRSRLMRLVQWFVKSLCIDTLAAMALFKVVVGI